MPRPRRTFEPPTYTFRVRILGGGYAPPNAAQIWREIELASTQTLADLGDAIPEAFDFDDPHLWAFFLSGKPWDERTEYALDPQPEPFGGRQPKAAARLPIHEVPGKEFLYIFDFGDEWHFGVKLARTSDTLEPGARYPRVVAATESPHLNTPISKRRMKMRTPLRPSSTEHASVARPP